MAPRIVYNVLIGGVSIGLTFKYSEATDWVERSMSDCAKEILPVPYQRSW